MKSRLQSTIPSFYLKWPRHILSRYIQAETGHEDFNEYHLEFNHPLADGTCPHCENAKTSRFHPSTSCQALEGYQDKILISPSTGTRLGLYQILDSRLGAACFKEFVEKKDTYQRIPNLPNPVISPSSSTSSDLLTLLCLRRAVARRESKKSQISNPAQRIKHQYLFPILIFIFVFIFILLETKIPTNCLSSFIAQFLFQTQIKSPNLASHCTNQTNFSKCIPFSFSFFPVL